jgi:outer membrane protein OmpA-like peptidoglycan-associated protein/opacity protein-like surface antigen
MKATINFTETLSPTRISTRYAFKSILMIALVCCNAMSTIQAQEVRYTKPSWWFGVAAGANFNFYRGSTHQLNSSFTPLTTFHDGDGIGLFVAPLLEYHKPNSRLGFQMQFGFDDRKAQFEQAKTVCDCPADLKTEISYWTVEPSLRFAPFQSNFYLFAGPRFAFIKEQSFVYQLGINPAYPNQTPTAEETGDLDQINKTIISMQIGAGIDIALSSSKNKTQFVLSPFASFHPYFGQNPRSVETLNITTIRAGVALKMGQGRRIISKEEVVEVIDPEVEFSVFAPTNVAAKRRVREVFPLRNYIFFTEGNTKIPSRYTVLKKEEVKDFGENQLEMVTPINASGRSERQMDVYYNLINIVGIRMVHYPLTSIVLVGSSENGPTEGLQMARSVATYLLDTFDIDPERIKAQGQFKPKVPSAKKGKKNELYLLRDSDRRVTIETLSPELLAEFKSGPSTAIVSASHQDEAPETSFVQLEVKGAEKALTSWYVQMEDSLGKISTFGPFTKDKTSLSGQSILENKSEGDYTIKLIGLTKSGKTIHQETKAHVVLWKPIQFDEGVRFSILFEFDESKAIGMYDKYLVEVVAPKIPKDGVVLIHGHTDTIGNINYNLKLSKSRANDVKNTLEKALQQLGRTDVKFEITGFGEDSNYAPFKNEYPEERFYNRTVIIDIFQESNSALSQSASRVH